jgi:ABC-2 type transport system permease protein
MNITKLLFLNFIRAKGFVIALAVLCMASLLSLYIGKTFIENHQKNIEKTAQAQQETIDRYVKFENKEMGLLLYYIKFGLVNETPNLAGLSIGQRDINPSAMSVTIRNLEEQKYNTELHNPMYQLLGNMDFSFVLIYFFPLVIISFCFNALSEEKESGIWKLLCSQTDKPFLIIFQKIVIRWVIIESLLLVLLFIAQIYLQIPFNLAWIIFGLMAFLYVLFWFALCTWIVSFQKNSNQNALLLLISWVLLTIVLPATANAFVSNTYPTQEAFETLIESRDGYHKKWDLEKEPTLQKFKTHYPQIASFQHPENKDFSWLWYYAMQQMGDDEAQNAVKQFKNKLAKREQLSKTIGYFFPTIHTQLIFNQLAQSDLNNQLQFWEALEQFHEKKRLHFYPKIFGDAPVLKENWQQWKLDFFNSQIQIQWMGIFLPMLLIIVIFLILSWVQLRKIRL